MIKDYLAIVVAVAVVPVINKTALIKKHYHH